MLKLNELMRRGVDPPTCIANFFMYNDIKHYFRHEIAEMLIRANEVADNLGLEDDTQERMAFVGTKARRLWNVNPDSKCGLFYNIDLKNQDIPGDSIIAIADQIMYLIADAIKRKLTTEEMN